MIAAEAKKQTKPIQMRNDYSERNKPKNKKKKNKNQKNKRRSEEEDIYV